MSSTRSDADLARRANAGHADAFEELYRRHKDWVLRLATRFCGGHADAADVVQESFLYLLSKVPNLHLDGRLTTLLYPTVKHLAQRAREKAGRYASDEEALDGARSPGEVGGESRDELARVLAGLPEEQREVVLMRYVDGMTGAEIASALALPLGTVKSRIHNALQALRSDERTRRYFER